MSIVVPTQASPETPRKAMAAGLPVRAVLTLILSGTVSNALLANFSPSPKAGGLDILAAMGIWSIIPYTFFYMEPNINGARKWKAQGLPKKEGGTMEENERATRKHGATPDARKGRRGRR